ncbi:MAG: GNAT family N-acetyltransferase [bacterium]|nr:GNAT family N-acetyltransferase [bacterium]
MQIRRKRDRDSEEANELFNICYPNYGAGTEVYIYNVEHEPSGRYSESFVGIKDDKVIGIVDISSLGNSPGTGEFFLTFRLHPDYRGRGFGRELYSQGECHLGYLDWKKVYSWCDAADVRTKAWLNRLGFVKAGRAIESVLDLTNYRKPDDYEETKKHTSEQGIRVKTFAEINAPEKERKLWELTEVTNADMPDPYPYQKRSFEEWREAMAAPNRIMDSIHIAIDEGRFVAHTKIYFNYGPGKHAITGSTGTLASHRNRGIAKALKYRMIDWAVANGVPSISTDNAEQNEYILRINRKLGFKPKTTWLDMVKKNEEG